MAKTLNINSNHGCKPGGVPSQMTGRPPPSKPSTKPPKASPSGALVMGPFGGKKPA